MCPGALAKDHWNKRPIDNTPPGWFSTKHNSSPGGFNLNPSSIKSMQEHSLMPCQKHQIYVALCRTNTYNLKLMTIKCCITMLHINTPWDDFVQERAKTVSVISASLWTDIFPYWHFPDKRKADIFCLQSRFQATQGPAALELDSAALRQLRDGAGE